MEKTKSSLSPQSILFILVVCLVVSVSIVSAANFDNIKLEKDKTFDGKDIKGNSLLEKYKPIEIKNSFGFGSTLFEGYLSQHDEICGQDCKSTMEIKLNQDGVLIDDVIFKTLQEDNSWIKQDVRSYQFLVNEEKYNVGDVVKVGLIPFDKEKDDSPTVVIKDATILEFSSDGIGANIKIDGYKACTVPISCLYAKARHVQIGINESELERH